MENHKVEEKNTEKLMFDKNIQKLNDQVEENFKFAFYNLLEERISSNPPDYDWLIRLYGEIKLKFCMDS